MAIFSFQIVTHTMSAFVFAKRICSSTSTVLASQPICRHASSQARARTFAKVEVVLCNEQRVVQRTARLSDQIHGLAAVHRTSRGERKLRFRVPANETMEAVMKKWAVRFSGNLSTSRVVLDAFHFVSDGQYLKPDDPLDVLGWDSQRSRRVIHAVPYSARDVLAN